MPLARDQAFLGVALSLVGLAGIPAAWLGGGDPLLVPVLFAIGIFLAVRTRHYLALDRDLVGEALPPPPLAEIEHPARTVFRTVPTLAAAAALMALAGVFDVGVEAAVAGLVSGNGVVELLLIGRISRWERAHDVPLYVSAKWFFLQREPTLYAPEPTDDVAPIRHKLGTDM